MLHSMIIVKGIFPKKLFLNTVVRNFIKISNILFFLVVRMEEIILMKMGMRNHSYMELFLYLFPKKKVFEM
jgi:hypothetical protein